VVLTTMVAHRRAWTEVVAAAGGKGDEAGSPAARGRRRLIVCLGNSLIPRNGSASVRVAALVGPTYMGSQAQ
jgi:hypothetical protein